MKIKLALVLTLMLSIISSTFASDIDTLYNRYWKIFLNNPSKASVDALLTKLNPDGSFSDLDYTSKTADLSIHLTRLKSFGGAYQTVGNAYYRDASIKTKYYTSLQYWITKNHTPSNWWFRHIAYPKAFGSCLFLMNVELQSEMPTLFSNAIAYLRWAYLQNNYMEGANGADKIYGVLPASILTKNNTELIEYQTKIKDLIAVQNKGEGIEVDWMYAQHSGSGRQVYANYEHEFLNSILSLLDLCKGTIYNVSTTELTILDNHLINGTQWYVYNNHQDPNQTGRKPSSSMNGRFPNNLNLLVGLNTPQNSEILTVQDRILNSKNSASKLTGNKMFWRFDYMIHRRKNYFVSSRLTSTRTVGMESGNGEGIYNYYSSAGLNFLFRTGKEYDGNYFTVMNYRQWPGITVEQDNAALPLVDWGSGSSNGNAFAGGVSDGLNGAIGTIYDKRNLTAHKSWFYFDDEYVALGSGITQLLGTAPVFTTLNQAVQNDNIVYSENNVQQSIATGSGTISVTNPDWILQDSIGYVNLLPSSNFDISSDNRSGTNIFTVGINHGTNPTNATYAYAVYPNTSASSITTYKANLPFQILSNTKTVQAVYHKMLKIVQAIFYTPGSLTLADGKVLTVNAPCALMIKDTNSTYQVTVGNPLCETSNPDSIVVTMNTQLSGTGIQWNETNSSMNIALPQGDDAGQSVSIIVYPNNCIPVFASSDDGNVPENTLDNDLNTRWSANGDGQYITFCLGTSKVINRVDIAFYLGDTRISTFDILISENGNTWENAAIGLKSSGKSTALESFTFLSQTGKYIKIIGHGNSLNTWNSYTEINFPSNVTTLFPNANLLSQIYIYPNPTNQNVTVSFGSECKVNAIEIYNEIGQSVYSKQLDKIAAAPESIDISKLFQGVYFVKIYTDNGAVFKKIIKN
jgi:chondroitin AC lyase